MKDNQRKFIIDDDNQILCHLSTHDRTVIIAERQKVLAEVMAVLDEHINNDTIEWDTWLKKRPALTKLKEEIKSRLKATEGVK